MNIKKNDPSLWSNLIPVPGVDSHKYSRGHVVILGGRRLTGAARMASEAAMRTGAGICTVIADQSAAQVYQCGAPHILFEPLKDFTAQISDKRRNAILIGPGAGHDDGKALRKTVIPALRARNDCRFILDADALTAFEGRSRELFEALNQNCILTPHEREFERLFGRISGSRADRAIAAVKQCGAIVVLKGAETIIAHPDGRIVVNDHASAGTGDVLAGMIAGLMAQGSMDPFQSACAAVWIHGEAGIRIGPGLVAPDLIALVPDVLKEILEDRT